METSYISETRTYQKTLFQHVFFKSPVTENVAVNLSGEDSFFFLKNKKKNFFVPLRPEK